MQGLRNSNMAAEGRTRVRLSVASQFFNNDDADTLVASGEYSAEDSTSEKVSHSNKSRLSLLCCFQTFMPDTSFKLQ